jgi:hypothetical protein
VNPRVCMCCGEPISEKGNTLSRNPNMCASCSSLLDGMTESPEAAPAEATPDQPQVEAKPEDTTAPREGSVSQVDARVMRPS